MVQIILASAKGNHGVRYFPYSGYLGLTALKVDGVVRTKLDPDNKPLQAKSITISVRCYETRLGLLGVMHSNVLVDYTQVLWSKPDGDHDYADIGDLELPFRITLPAKVAGFSTASYASAYKCSWRVEAIINHAPILGVGSRQIKHSELPLLRFGLPPALESLTPVVGPSLLSSEISHPHWPSIRYSINSPTTPIGPLDLVSIPIHLHPSDPSVSFRSASVVVERRMQFFDPTSPPSTPTLPSLMSSSAITIPSPPSSSSLPIPQRTSSSSSSLMSYSPASSYKEPSTHLSSSTTLQASDSRSSPNNASYLVNSVVGTESSGLFSRADSGVWSKTLTLQWPAAKSHSRWAIGETIESELVSVKFFVRVKIVVSSSFGTESLELEERELLVVSTNETERQLALSKYNDARSEGARSKSKSPRRTHRQTDDAPPLPASASRAEHPHRVSASSSHYSASASSSKPPRRPHTSAGVRDKSRMGVSVSEPENSKDTDPRLGDEFRRRRAMRPDTDRDVEIGVSHRAGKGHFNPPLTVATTAVDSGGSGSSTSLSTSSNSPDSNSDEVREWEEELARIEMRSRRSSDLVGFATRRLRPGEP
ncbi:hypothetical protein B0H16DRAFT_1547146 [Mycena metata]|uniref:Uncharacterized protein n=1 Tax=Mycena metata TaxID=1033252 RepID=A0AAD7IWM5_9AGAR|nr:hypothetical protein B0H16DRAFT_1547146 [Mycena metata]